MEERIYLLEMIGISKKINGVKMLDSITLQLEAGTVHAILDKSGTSKNTLIKCLFGLIKEDEGKILMNGKQCSFVNAEQALKNGVALVHHEMSQVPRRSVMENIWVERSSKKMYEDTLKIFDELKTDVNPKERFSDLSIAKKQIVEIAKAISYNAKILVFNEPAVSLSDNEIEQLFKIINILKSKGYGIIYISHTMSEILQVADTVSVLRDGRIISTTPVGDLS